MSDRITATVQRVPGSAAPDYCWTTQTKYHPSGTKGWIAGHVNTVWQREVAALADRGRPAGGLDVDL